MKKVILVLLMGILSGCASSTYLVTGTKRPAIDVAEVKLYTTAPREKYEEVAQITASMKDAWTDQGRQDAAIKELKNRAASLGANGVILTDVTGASGGTGYGVNSYGQTSVFFGRKEVMVRGTAIYLP